MSNNFKKVAVLGAGVMGAQISGHLANAGIPSFLFDINKELSENGKKTLTTLKPAPLYQKKNVCSIFLLIQNVFDHVQYFLNAFKSFCTCSNRPIYVVKSHI